MATLDELSRLVADHEAAFAQALAEADAVPATARAAAIEALTIGWTGRKSGRLADLMGHLPSLPAADRRAFGQLVNALKSKVEQALTERALATAATRRPAGAVDVTLPGRAPALGHRHPLSLVREEVQAIFTRLGYQVLEGPEIEDDWHNFEALNMPEEHPARDMQDTLYLATPLHPPASPVAPKRTESAAADHAGSAVAAADGTAAMARRSRRTLAPQPLTLLRTHTSAMQIRHMERHDPPVRLVAIGPVYRRDNLDLTHTPMFHQCEGLVVGRGITLAHLKGTLLAMAEALFGAGTPVRFRPSFFPYTEPSAEVDVGCIRCGGVGCPVCKHTGWLEILGSGMVHPAVFEAVGYDPAEVTGFAFGMGIERVAMLKWDVGDIRLFYENDLRFLQQFGR
jgi:phenylalanyl-tRNA synthetase alpha chain